MRILYILILITYIVFGNDYKVVDIFDDTPINSNIKVKTKKVIKKKHKIKAINKKKKKVFKKKSIKKENKKELLNSDKKVIHKNKRAKLAIIIDDIAHKYQLNMVKSLPFKVTPSIFPPNHMNMNTQNLAKGLKHFLVHLPLQSDSKAMNRMYKTLFVTNSDKKIIARVKEIKRLFPNVKYINNHTGSIFCQNYKKSKVLFKALLDNKINFIDSRTTQKSQFRKIAKEFGVRYLHNNHFIDNKVNINYILKEIKRGVSLAKKRGYAIIIGHPHMQTFKALKMAKKYFKNIDLVYIDEL